MVNICLDEPSSKGKVCRENHLAALALKLQNICQKHLASNEYLKLQRNHLSALGYVRLRSISFRTTADTVAPRHSKKVSHAQHPIWRYMRACRHSQLFEASAIANKFASHGLRTTATPFYISPNRVIVKNFCSALGFCVCLHIICSGEVPRGSGSY